MMGDRIKAVFAAVQLTTILNRQKKCDAALNYHHRDFALFAGWQWYSSLMTRRSGTMFSSAPNAAPSF
jgi:hypothetical protein